MKRARTIRCPKATVHWHRSLFTVDGKPRIGKAGKVIVLLKEAFEKAERDGGLGSPPA